LSGNSRANIYSKKRRKEVSAVKIFSVQRKIVQNNKWRREMKKVIGFTLMVCMVFFVASVAFCGSEGEGGKAKEKIFIGLSFPTLQQERWARERDIFIARAEELGAEVAFQAANDDETIQMTQCENLLTQGIDILVLTPVHTEAAAAIIEMCHNEGIKVIAYERLIKDCDLDYYISFDCEYAGVLQAEYAVSVAPKGNYILIGGAPTDFNAHLLRSGQMKVLQPYIDRGDINVVMDQWAKNWDPKESLKYTEDGLTANNNDVQFVLTSNDGTAGASCEAIAEQGLAGKILTTGIDADLPACQRIVEGTQGQTTFRDFAKMARISAEVAVQMAKGEQPSGYKMRNVNNDYKNVPAIDLNEFMYSTTKYNMMDTVIKSGWLKKEDVYKNIPKSQWPK
jgi:D-xylose transport system substrate-binding protein